jgi:hypothetical protein
VLEILIESYYCFFRTLALTISLERKRGSQLILSLPFRVHREGSLKVTADIFPYYKNFWN